MNLHEKKDLFNLSDNITYLNTASLSPSFKSVEAAGITAVLEKSQPYKIPASDFFDPVIELKSLFAKIIDVENYNRIATIPSVSYGMATVANNIKLNSGDEIIVIEEQFPSNIYAWKALAKQYKASIKTIKQPKTKKNCGKLWNNAIINAISDKTAVVAMGNIHWTNGTIFNLKAIRAKTRVHKSLLIIDGSQSVGAFPFSVKEIEPDALICAGYKWLFGPYGCAYAYYGSYFDNGTPIENNWANRLGSENLADLTTYQDKYKPLANRYDVGESGSFIYTKMQIAALKEILKLSPLNIQEYCKTITLELVHELKVLGCYIEDNTLRAHHLFGIKLPNYIAIEPLKMELKKQNIYVSFRGNYMRVSCHYFNTSHDFKKLLNCVTPFLNHN